ncbi:MAG: DUF721 domain-containing protein [Desulfobacterales bacterium]|nr:DUF721 domain-containing protein [Desulfobacterales bacterium]
MKSDQSDQSKRSTQSAGGGFVHIGSLLDGILKKYRRDYDEGIERIWETWEGAVGKAIAENARPEAFRGKELLVYVNSSAWLHQLGFLKKDIIKKVNEALGADLVKEIRFKIGST